MPWRERDVLSLKQELIKAMLEGELSTKELCERYEVSRKTAYKWLNRYEAMGLDGLKELSRRPLSNPQKTRGTLLKKIIEVREKHPRWGGRKIKVVLERTGLNPVPTASTISKLLKKAGYIGEEASNQRERWKRFEHASPNHLWQMDFKGHFAFEKGRCYPLTILDDHSRFAVGLEACKNEKRLTVQKRLIEIFSHYGLPHRINVDNGNPWGSLFAYARYTTFAVWLIKVGVKISYSKPGHPQTNGKDERFHRTLKEELIVSAYFKNLLHIQNQFNQWKEIYNYERPHQAIGMKVPADRYHPSYRAYKGILPFHYADDYEKHITDCRGRIYWEGRQIFIGMPFAKEQIGIRRTVQDNEIDIYFRHQKLGSINLALFPKKTLINLYSKRISIL